MTTGFTLYYKVSANVNTESGIAERPWIINKDHLQNSALRMLLLLIFYYYFLLFIIIIIIF